MPLAKYDGNRILAAELRMHKTIEKLTSLDSNVEPSNNINSIPANFRPNDDNR
jgi:hypothetical protein